MDQQALTILTTEHFTLQGARSQTVSESAARSALYLGTLSSVLITLGFLAQAAGSGDVFRVFATVILPTLYLLGLFTFTRLVELSVEDIIYGRAINRIRAYYKAHAGEAADYLMLGANDDAIGVVRNMGLGTTWWQLYVASANAIAVVNSVVGGTAVAYVASYALDASLAVAVIVGAVVFAVSFAACRRIDRHVHLHGGGFEEAMFPSAPARG